MLPLVILGQFFFSSVLSSFIITDETVYGSSLQLNAIPALQSLYIFNPAQETVSIIYGNGDLKFRSTCANTCVFQINQQKGNSGFILEQLEFPYSGLEGNYLSTCSVTNTEMAFLVLVPTKDSVMSCAKWMDAVSLHTKMEYLAFDEWTKTSRDNDLYAVMGFAIRRSNHLAQSGKKFNYWGVSSMPFIISKPNMAAELKPMAAELKPMAAEPKTKSAEPKTKAAESKSRVPRLYLKSLDSTATVNRETRYNQSPRRLPDGTAVLIFPSSDSFESSFEPSGYENQSSDSDNQQYSEYENEQYSEYDESQQSLDSGDQQSLDIITRRFEQISFNVLASVFPSEDASGPLDLNTGLPQEMIRSRRSYSDPPLKTKPS